MEKKVEVIIPAYRPEKDFTELLRRLEKQEYPVSRVIVMNTEETYWNEAWEGEFPFLEVHHLKKTEFDHGATRRRGAELSDGDIIVFMTQDAMPADRKLIGNLIRPILEEVRVGAAYARQLPKEDCGFLERYSRSFNYPPQSCIKREKDVNKYGVKTYFCSNVCAAYDREVYRKVGGFAERAIFNEDMIYAGHMAKQGWGIAYAADARVIHSHNYSCMQQFHRNFDLGVSQADHPEVFDGVSSEGEGLRLVKRSLGYLCKKGRFWLIPQLFFQSAFKYAGYFLGKRYRRLPKRLVRLCSMNRTYWENV